MDPIRRALDAELMEMLVGRGVVEIQGFGSLKSMLYRAYEGRDPRTGQIVHVPATRNVFFTAAPELRERIADDRRGERLPIAAPDLVVSVAARTAEPRDEVATALAQWLNGVVDASEVHTLGRPVGAAGILQILTKPATQVRNPQTAEMIDVPARRVVAFTTSRCARVRMGGGTLRGYIASPRVAELLAAAHDVLELAAALDAVADGAVLTEDDTCAVLEHAERVAPAIDLEALLAKLPY